MEKFCLVKGKEGWGDRLQCLLQAMYYAEKTNRHLVLDWRDDDWCHDKTEDVSKYFTIENNCKYTLKTFLQYYQENKNRLTIAPRDWVGKITNENFKFYTNKKYHFGRGQDILYKIASNKHNISDFSHDIVVYPFCGHRAWTWNQFKNIKLSNMMETELVCTYLKLNISKRKYNVVHLRGGSKAWNGGHVGQKALRERINETFPTKDSYFNFMYSKYEKTCNKNIPVVILTDYRPMAEEWIERYNCGILLTDTHNEKFDKCGTHKISKANMGGLSKQTLTIEALRDFALMINCEKIVHDEISYMSNMAFGIQTRKLNFKENKDFSNLLRKITSNHVK